MNISTILMLSIFFIVSVLVVNKYINTQRLLKIEKKIAKKQKKIAAKKVVEKKIVEKKIVKQPVYRQKPVQFNNKLSKKCYLDIKDYGRLTIELFTDITPLTCENFSKLCANKKYVNIPFHRIIKGFMLQGGDIVNKNGTGSYSIYGRQFRDENFVRKHDEPGLLSMANSGPDTNGCQFFITTNKQPHLDGKHVVFGKVIKGMDIIYKLERIPTDSNDKPIHNVTIIDCGILDS